MPLLFWFLISIIIAVWVYHRRVSGLKFVKLIHCSEFAYCFAKISRTRVNIVAAMAITIITLAFYFL